jgi:cellulose biosynthesis protein BcsQ
MKISHNYKDILFQFNNAEVLIRNVPLKNEKREERNVTPKQKQLEENMKQNDRVETSFGPGTIIYKEDKRFCVALDFFEKLEGVLKETHNKYGGIFFWKNELKRCAE